jgi:hypothetical protein
MVDIIILNPIGYFKVDIDSTCFVSRPNVLLKITIMVFLIELASLYVDMSVGQVVLGMEQ